MRFRDRWKNVNNCVYTGTVFDGNTKMEPSSYFKNKFIAKEDCADYLNRANGFWGAVVTDGCSKGWMAADRIRSYPLFYAQKDGILYISDDAYWIREECQLEEIDKDAEEEFLMTGYVTGPDTLFTGLKQIQQGEIIFFEWSIDEGKYIISSFRYYRYIHKIPSGSSVDVLLDKLDHVMISSFKRLIDFADGNTIVIPLSGGYDSRLVVLMLKRLGYDNLIAYTYGVQNNEEARISKEVAASLNIPWYFVEYTPEKWYEMYHSEEYRGYERFAGGLASLPHAQDWIAVRELKQKKIIQEDSVFVPGLISNVGGFSTSCPKVYKEESKIHEGVLYSYLFHYKPILSSNKAHVFKLKYIDRIYSRVGDLKLYSSAASVFESFNFSERQAKYINNSIRGYEYWGYKHWTVFWDNFLLDYWVTLPWSYIRYKMMYKKYLTQESNRNQLFQGKEEIREKPMGKTRKWFGKFYRKYINNSIFINISFIRKMIIKKRINEDSMAWYGCFSHEQINDFFKKGFFNIIRMLSYDYINNIKLISNNKL